MSQWPIANLPVCSFINLIAKIIKITIVHVIIKVTIPLPNAKYRCFKPLYDNLAYILSKAQELWVNSW